MSEARVLVRMGIESAVRSNTEAIELAQRELKKLKRHRVTLWRRAWRVGGLKHREIAKLSKVKTSTVSGVLAPGAK